MFSARMHLSKTEWLQLDWRRKFVVTLRVLHIIATKDLQGTHLSRPSRLSVPFTASGRTWRKPRNTSSNGVWIRHIPSSATPCLSFGLACCCHLVHQVLQNTALLTRTIGSVLHFA